jgi:hypothetical protein
MRVIKADEPLLVNNIKVMVYGEPGAGKSSFAFSAKKPICYDFDEGAHRSGFRKDVWQFDSWSEAAAITASDLKEYDTIIIDTVGRQLDMISAHVIMGNNKMSTRAGNLTLQGYGELKSIFAQWVKRIMTMGKDIIFIAHSKGDKDGDTLIMRPDIQGSSEGEVFKIADGVAYVRVINNRRTIDFRPTEQHAGKDTARIGLAEIPDLNNTPSFGSDLVQKIKDSINSASEAGRKATEDIKSFRSRLDKCNDLNCLNDLRKEIAGVESKLVKDKSKAILIQRMTALDARWSTEKECFIYVKVKEPAGPRTIEWYESAADSIDNGVFEWWENEKGNARRDLNDDDFAKMESTISQLVDIEGDK